MKTIFLKIINWINSIRRSSNHSLFRLKPFLKEYGSLVISCLALSLSALTFFYSNLREDNQLIARAINTEHNNHTDSSKITDSVFADLLHSNTGNREIILLSPKYMVSSRDSFPFISNLDSSNTNRIGSINSKHYPVTLPAKTSKLIRIGFSEAELLSDWDRKHTKSNYYNKYISIVFEAVDFSTKRHWQPSEFCLWALIKENKINDFELWKVGENSKPTKVVF